MDVMLFYYKDVKLISNSEDLELSVAKIKQWYAFLNDAAGLLAFSLFITAMTSKNPAVIATLSSVFLAVWLLIKGRGVAKFLRKDERIHGYFSSNLGAIGGTFVFLVSYGLLLATSFGYITIESFSDFSFAYFINLNISIG